MHVTVSLPALMRSASSLPFTGYGPMPSSPFSLCNVREGGGVGGAGWVQHAAGKRIGKTCLKKQGSEGGEQHLHDDADTGLQVVGGQGGDTDAEIHVPDEQRTRIRE